MSEMKWTKGPWIVFNLVSELGERMTPEELGQYVRECVNMGSFDHFLAISHETGGPDICHVGNGPKGPYNANLIAAAPELYEALVDAQEELRLLRMKDTEVVYDPTLRSRIAIALAKARGEK